MLKYCKIWLYYLAINIPLYQLELYSRKAGLEIGFSMETLKYIFSFQISPRAGDVFVAGKRLPIGCELREWARLFYVLLRLILSGVTVFLAVSRSIKHNEKLNYRPWLIRQRVIICLTWYLTIWMTRWKNISSTTPRKPTQIIRTSEE